MHAFGNKIHAVTKPTPVGRSIAAAMATPDFRAVQHLLAKADIDPYAQFVTNGGQIKVADLDARLEKVHMGRFDRMVLKSTLDRLGLLVK